MVLLNSGPTVIQISRHHVLIFDFVPTLLAIATFPSKYQRPIQILKHVPSLFEDLDGKLSSILDPLRTLFWFLILAQYQFPIQVVDLNVIVFRFPLQVVFVSFAVDNIVLDIIA